MAADDQNLQINIEAVDNASSVVDNVKSSLTSLDQAVTQATSAMQNMGSVTVQDIQAFQEMGLPITESQQAMLNAAKAAEQETAALVTLAVQANVAAASMTELSTAEEENAAAASEGSEANQSYGVNVENMLTRISARMVIFGAVMEAINFLKSATDDAAKSNDAYVKSMEGTNSTMEQTKMHIGDALLPAFEMVKQALGDTVTGLANASGGWDNFNQVVFRAGQGIAIAVTSVITVFKELWDMSNLVVGAIVEYWKGAGAVIADVAIAIDDAVHGKFGDAKDALKDIGTTAANTWDNIKNSVSSNVAQMAKDIDVGYGEIQKITNEKMPKLSLTPPGNNKLGDELKKVQDAYQKTVDAAHDALQKLSDEHTTKVGEITDKISKLQTSYDDLTKKQADDLKKLADSHQQAADAIAQQIKKVQDSIAQLNQDLADKQTKNIETLAEAFVKAKDDVASLQDQLNNWKTPDTIGKTQLAILKLQEQLSQTKDVNSSAYIQEQIKQQQEALQAAISADAQKKQEVQDKLSNEQSTLASSADLQVQYADQIAAAQKKSQESTLQLAIDNFNTQQQLAQTQHDTKLAQLQDEMTALNAKAALEQQKYNDAVIRAKAETATKQAELTKQIGDLTTKLNNENQLYKDKTDKINELLADAEKYRQDQTNKTLANTKAALEKEIDLYNQLATAIRNAQSAASSNLVSMSAAKNLPHFADGGIVTSPTVGLIGEAGPEAVIPLSQAGGTLGTTVNITINGDVSGEDIAEKIGDKLVRILQQSTATV